MRVLAAVLDLVLAAFTALVVATEGMSDEPVFVVLTVVAVAVPLASAAALSRRRAADGRPIAALEKATAVANGVLFALACWAIVKVYPHPPEEGVVAFQVLLLAAPIVTVVALLRPGIIPAARAASR